MSLRPPQSPDTAAADESQDYGSSSLLVADGRATPTVPFVATWLSLQRPGSRRFLLAWLGICLFVVPSGMLTRILEWTGLPIRVGGVEVYVTVYLPLLLCVPMTLWFGYLWSAIPAYLSTFAVGVLGGIPWVWNAVFSFANPLGLAVLWLGFRSLPLRRDLRSIPSATYYVVLVFASSVAGATGAFFWASFNRIGVEELYPVWQGWWLGGFLQGVTISAGLLAVATPAVQRWLSSLQVLRSSSLGTSRGALLVPAIVLLVTVFAYTLIVRGLSAATLDRLVATRPELVAVEAELVNLQQGLALALLVLLLFVALTLFFGYRAGAQWGERYRFLAGELEISNAELQRLAVTDSLTGLFNHSYLMSALERELSFARRHETPLSCIVLDIDHFKTINDRHGHLFGDQVLRTVASQLSRDLRTEDVLARFGGEEFVVVLPSTTLEAALELAERLRSRIASTCFEAEGERQRVTTSAGVAGSEWERLPTDGDDLLRLADRALYRAKAEGRNRVEVEPIPS